MVSERVGKTEVEGRGNDMTIGVDRTRFELTFELLNAQFLTRNAKNTFYFESCIGWKGLEPMRFEMKDKNREKMGQRENASKPQIEVGESLCGPLRGQ